LNHNERTAVSEAEDVRDALRGELALIGAERHAVQVVRFTSGRVLISAEVSVPVARHIANRLQDVAFTPEVGMVMYCERNGVTGEIAKWASPQRIVLRDLATGAEAEYWLPGLRPALLAEIERAGAAAPA
jgi:hypothetical protein